MATIATGLGKQVLGELSGLVKDSAKAAVKAGGDIAKGTVETVVGGGGDDQQQAPQTFGQPKMMKTPDSSQQFERKKEIERRRGLDRVRKELAEYVAKKNQEEKQEEAVEERQEEVKKEQDEQKKKSERDMIINRARRSHGGTGEIARKKN